MASLSCFLQVLGCPATCQRCSFATRSCNTWCPASVSFPILICIFYLWLSVPWVAPLMIRPSLLAPSSVQTPSTSLFLPPGAWLLPPPSPPCPTSRAWTSATQPPAPWTPCSRQRWRQEAGRRWRQLRERSRGQRERVRAMEVEKEAEKAGQAEAARAVLVRRRGRCLARCVWCGRPAAPAWGQARWVGWVDWGGVACGRVGLVRWAAQVLGC